MNKVVYTSGTSVISADNLNDIQDNIVSQGNAIDKIEDALGGGNLTSKFVDYVVEQGTSGGWTYQKWNSGIIKAWRQTTSSNLSATQDGGINGWYYRIYNISIPSGLFKTVTSAMCNCKWGTGCSFASARDMSTTNFGAIYYSNQDGGAGTFWHEITGTWK